MQIEGITNTQQYSQSNIQLCSPMTIYSGIMSPNTSQMSRFQMQNYFQSQQSSTRNNNTNNSTIQTIQSQLQQINGNNNNGGYNLNGGMTDRYHNTIVDMSGMNQYEQQELYNQSNLLQDTNQLFSITSRISTLQSQSSSRQQQQQQEQLEQQQQLQQNNRIQQHLDQNGLEQQIVDNNIARVQFEMDQSVEQQLNNDQILRKKKAAKIFYTIYFIKLFAVILNSIFLATFYHTTIQEHIFIVIGAALFLFAVGVKIVGTSSTFQTIELIAMSLFFFAIHYNLKNDSSPLIVYTFYWPFLHIMAWVSINMKFNEDGIKDEQQFIYLIFVFRCLAFIQSIIILLKVDMFVDMNWYSAFVPTFLFLAFTTVVCIQTIVFFIISLQKNCATNASIGAIWENLILLLLYICCWFTLIGELIYLENDSSNLILIAIYLNISAGLLLVTFQTIFSSSIQKFLWSYDEQQQIQNQNNQLNIFSHSQNYSQNINGQDISRNLPEHQQQQIQINSFLQQQYLNHHDHLDNHQNNHQDYNVNPNYQPNQIIKKITQFFKKISEPSPSYIIRMSSTYFKTTFADKKQLIADKKEQKKMLSSQKQQEQQLQNQLEQGQQLQQQSEQNMKQNQIMKNKKNIVIDLSQQQSSNNDSQNQQQQNNQINNNNTDKRQDESNSVQVEQEIEIELEDEIAKTMNYESVDIKQLNINQIKSECQFDKIYFNNINNNKNNNNNNNIKINAVTPKTTINYFKNSFKKNFSSLFNTKNNTNKKNNKQQQQQSNDKQNSTQQQQQLQLQNNDDTREIEKNNNNDQNNNNNIQENNDQSTTSVQKETLNNTSLISSNSKTDHSTIKDKKDISCVICFENYPNTIFMNCGHGGICKQCAVDVSIKTGVCFLCREPIKQIIRVKDDQVKKKYQEVVSVTYIASAKEIK